MEFIEVSAKNLSDAITEACQRLGVTSDRLHYDVIEEGSNGFLGIGSKPAVIKAAIKEEVEEKTDSPVISKVSESVKTDHSQKTETVSNVSAVSDGSVEKRAETFLNDVFKAMNLEVTVAVRYDAAEKSMDIDLNGDEMGILIGKRGQTLDSLQYLVSLVVNKNEEEYVRVKVDTENYRQRRKDTLENLARNISFKVRRNGKTVTLEPMNPYERRVIHSALQNDRYVETHSEGEEPFRRVVVSLKEGVKIRENNNNRHRRYGNNKNYNRNNNSKKGGGRE